MNAATYEYLSVEDAINDMDDEEVVCRGGHHNYPLDKIRPGKRLKGVDAVRQIDGCYQVIETCLDCGLVERTSVTLPGGAYDTEVLYRYRYAKHWIKVPADLGRPGKRTFKRELDNRDGRFTNAVLAAAASHPAERDGAAEEAAQGRALGNSRGTAARLGSAVPVRFSNAAATS